MVSRIISQRGGRRDSQADVRVWREVGWIFSNGETFTIERRGDQTRVREGLIFP